MAVLHYAAASSSAASALRRRWFFAETFYPRKPNLLISCVSSSFPSKSTRRKNHLRQKILKTLKQPSILKPIGSPPLEEFDDSCTVQEILESEKCGNSEAGNEEVENLQELGAVRVEVSAPTGKCVDESISVLDKNSFLQFGMWFIGAFVFQTVCAVWVFGSSGIGDKNGDMAGNGGSSVTEKGGNGKDRSRVGIVLQGNGNARLGVEHSATDSVVYVDELEMERKIEEIRVMAREAREKERLESKKDGYDSEDESDGEKHSKSAIEEEVDNRLIRLQKKLENASKKMPVASAGHSGKDGMRKVDIEGEPEEGEGNGALLFQKKYKFKGLPFDLLEKPKGFTGSNDYRVNKESEGMGKKGDDELFRSVYGDIGAIDLVDGEKPAELSHVDTKGSDEIHVVEEDKGKDMSEVKESTKDARRTAAKEQRTSKQGKKKSALKPKLVDGSEKNNGRSTLGAVTARKINANGLKSRKSNDLGITVGDGGPKGKGDADCWWLNLPYVLVIVMQRGNNGEGGEGFYTLKCISSTEDHGISHMVGFEDQVDANNFCYLLQSFFEEMADFRADVVPLTAKELNEVVISRTMKAVVVKRGQLQLYVGQALDEAEMALHALIESQG